MMILRGFCLASSLCLSLMTPLATRAQQPLPAEGDEPQLLEVLKSDAELFDKAKVCQRLAVIGTADSVPVLSKLLAEPELSHYARFAMESNPSPEVDKALRNAMPELNGPQLVGVINSIAVRRDALAVDVLKEALDDENQDVAAAAAAALGAIATPESIAAIQQTLQSSETLRVTAADACLAAADRWLTDGMNAEALKILAAVRSAELPKHINVASRFGEIREGSRDADELMNSYLREDDRHLFRIGLELAHELTDADATSQLIKLFESLPPARQRLLMQVFGDRGEVSALPTVIAAVDSDDKSMQVAAIRVLGMLGDGNVVPILLEAAASEDEVLAETARDSLVMLRGDGIDDQLARRMEESDGRERIALVDVAGRRGISQVIPLLLKYVSDDDPSLRKSAIDGLGMTVGLKDFPELIDQMLAMGATASAKPMKEALRKACQRMGDRDAASRVLFDRMSGATPANRAELMDLLIYVGGDQALSGVQAAALGSDDAAADAATKTLGRWLTPDVAPVLLKLAQSGNEKYRVRCLRGYIRIIRQFGLKSGKRLQMSKQAMAAATRDEERSLVLDTLTRFPSAQGLRMATAQLNNPSLREDASRAAVVIGEQIVGKDPKSVAAAMEKVADVTKDAEIAGRAKVLITRAK